MALIQNAGPGTLAGDLAEIPSDAFNELARKYETKYVPELGAHAVVVPDALYRDRKGKRVYLGGDAPTPEQIEAVDGLAEHAAAEHRANSTRSLRDAGERAARSR